MVIASPSQGSPWIRRALLPLASSSVSGMCRTFQPRPSRWQNWHVLFGWNFYSRIVRSALGIDADALNKFRGIFWHFFQFRKLRMAIVLRAA